MKRDPFTLFSVLGPVPGSGWLCVERIRNHYKNTIRLTLPKVVHYMFNELFELSIQYRATPLFDDEY